MGWDYTKSKWYQEAVRCYRECNEDGMMGSEKRLVVMAERVAKALEAENRDLRAKLEAVEREFRGASASNQHHRELLAQAERDRDVYKATFEDGQAVILGHWKPRAEKAEAALQAANAENARLRGRLSMLAHAVLAGLPETEDLASAALAPVQVAAEHSAFCAAYRGIGPCHDECLVKRKGAIPAQEAVKPIGRNLSTPENRAFWAHVDKCVAEVATWPAWKRAGVDSEQPGTAAPVLPVDQRPKARAVFDKRRYWMCSFSGVIAGNAILLDRKCTEHDHYSDHDLPDGGKRFPEEG